MPEYCDVAVPVPLDAVFTYRLPDGIQPPAGGRVLDVLAQGDTPAHARERAYAAAERITWRGRFYRSDIAASEGRVEITA